MKIKDVPAEIVAQWMVSSIRCNFYEIINILELAVPDRQNWKTFENLVQTNQETIENTPDLIKPPDSTTLHVAVESTRTSCHL